MFGITSIKPKYSFNRNTYTKKERRDIERKLDVVIGDETESEFIPQVKFKHFDNEYNWSFRAICDLPGKLKEEGDLIKYVTPEYEIHQYDKPDASDEGGHELEWYLPKKPKTNILKASIRTKGNVSFHKQPIPTDEELHNILLNTKRSADRILRVAGSYAIYIDKQNHVIGEKNYANGKIGHIFTPVAYDSTGKKVYCDLQIPTFPKQENNTEITVSVPQEFLDSAVYPIVIDPTFGYTTAGSGSYAIYTKFDCIGSSWDSLIGNIHTLTENGDITSLSFHTTDSFCGGTAIGNVKALVYKKDGNGSNSHTLEGTKAGVTGGGETWNTFTFDSAISAVADDYLLCVFGDNTSSATEFGLSYDSVSGNIFSGVFKTSYSYESPPSPMNETPLTTLNRYSIYATYTATGSTIVKTPTRGLLGVGN